MLHRALLDRMQTPHRSSFLKRPDRILIVSCRMANYASISPKFLECIKSITDHAFDISTAQAIVSTFDLK